MATKQDPLLQKNPKEIYSLFKLMRNLVSGTLISAKITTVPNDSLSKEDLTVSALKYLIEQEMFEAPALLNGIESGVNNYETFRDYFDFKHFQQKNKNKQSLSNNTNTN